MRSRFGGSWWLAGLVLCCVAAGTAATSPADLTTPKGALRAASQAIRDGGLDAAVGVYHVTSPGQRELARSLAQVDLACSHLEDAMIQKFGAKTSDQALHELGAKVDSDVDAATENVERDKATVRWSDGGDVLHMVRVDGEWKVDIEAEFAGLDERAIHSRIAMLKHAAVGADRLADQVADGQLAIPEAAIAACRQQRTILAALER